MMDYFLLIWLCPVALAVGVGFGWPVWGRTLEEQRTHHRFKLHRVMRNRELVESRLTTALR